MQTNCYIISAMPRKTEVPKHRYVFRTLEREIQLGRWAAGTRIPSEAELVARFGVSRITVGRAVRDLQRAGLVERRVGAGTFVATPGERETAAGYSFGLLIPNLGETEIFEPICQGMMASPQAREHALLWGSGVEAAGRREERAWQLCLQYIERRVSGVFFAPLELSPDKDELNRRIVAALDAAAIPVVLLDRPVLPFPERGPNDLVGIDHRRAGYLMSAHLLRLGCRRVGFLAVPDAAATVDAREAGYREALFRLGADPDPVLVRRLDPADTKQVREYLATARPDGVVCANDWTAAHLLGTLRELGVRVPADVRVVGIDDVDYAAFLPVPLTTLRQPTRELGAVALATMLDRIQRPDLPPRDILLHGELIIRQSCGGRT